MTESGLPLPGLPRLFEALGQQPWTVYRFLRTPQAELGGRMALEALKAGEVEAFPDPLGWRPGLNRFSDPSGRAYGVIYLGSSAKVAFVETVLRDQADGRGADCMVDVAEIDKRLLASIRVRETLRLVDLTGDGPLRMGVPSDVVGARDHTLAQQWSVAFHGHPNQPDGVFYPSRLNEQRCIALYDRGRAKLDVVATPRLWDCNAQLAAILDDLQIALV